MNNWARDEMGVAGLGYVQFEKSGDVIFGKGPIAKFLSPSVINSLYESAKVQNGDAVFFSCGTPKEANEVAAKARLIIGEKLEGFSDQFKEIQGMDIIAVDECCSGCIKHLDCHSVSSSRN